MDQIILDHLNSSRTITCGWNKNEGEKILEYPFVQIIRQRYLLKRSSIRIHFSLYFRCSIYLLQVKYFFLASKTFYWDFFRNSFLLFVFSAQKMNKYEICLGQGMIKAPDMGWNFMQKIQPFLWYLSFSRAPLCMISRLLWHNLFITSYVTKDSTSSKLSTKPHFRNFPKRLLFSIWEIKLIFNSFFFFLE